MPADATSDFMREQERAVERMRRMSERASINPGQHKMPPVPPFVRLQNEPAAGRNQPGGTMRHEKPQSTGQQHRENPSASQESAPHRPRYYKHERPEGEPFLFSGLNLKELRIPFLDSLHLDRDILLIIGIGLLLVSEKADRKLLIALLYILL